MRSLELLQKIQALSNSPKLKHTKTTVSKGLKRVSVKFISPIAVEENQIREILTEIQKHMPYGYSVDVEIEKLVTQAEFVKKAVLSELRENHKIICGALSDSAVEIALSDAECLVKVSVENAAYDYLCERQIADKLKAYLEISFPDNFVVEFLNSGKTEVNTENLLKGVKGEEEVRLVIRKLKVDAVTRLFDDDETAEASYICDTRDFVGEVYLAGKVTKITEKLTKTDKPYYLIDFSDRTGSVSGAIFPNKDKLPKMKKIAEGSEIIIRGEYQVRNNYNNLRILSINYCCFPKNFVPEPRPKRPVPREYKLIEPKPIVVESQANFLEDKSVPECFLGRTFVIFDFETTGTDMTDKVTEIGAVKLVDGKFTEYFDTLVNPMKHIPKEVEDITGINDETVKDAPLFKDVCADFYKFCYGSTLVAHNIEFDSRFLRKESAPLDFYYDNPQLDTLQIAREVLPELPHHKLNNLCDKFGIVFRHHRAYSDALATGELLIELIRLRKGLPE